MNIKAREVAALIDHAVLHPTASDEDVREGCALAMKYEVASVCVKPYAVSLAKLHLQDSDVKVSTVIGFPHGGQSTDIKVSETVQALNDGAEEIDMVINIGKALSGDLEYVGNEIAAILNVVKSRNGLLKVIFEIGYIRSHELLIKLCHLCNTIGVDYVKTSTGFAYVRNAEGLTEATGATLDAVRLMREHCLPSIGVKASGGVRTIETVIEMRNLGATRIGTSSTEAIIMALKS